MRDISIFCIHRAVYLLGDNIVTDQILSAEFLKVNPSTPEGAQLFADAVSGRSACPIIVAGKIFGYGSSREHATVALGAAGVKAVLAQSCARAFFRSFVVTGELLLGPGFIPAVTHRRPDNN